MVADLCSPWITGATVIAERPEAIEGIPPSVVDRAATGACEVLFALSGRKFPGECAATLRPAARPVGWTVHTWTEHLMSLTGYGFVGSWGYCSGGDHRRCLDRAAIDLGVYPLRSVDRVTVDGTVLPSTAYRVDADRLLVRLDGGGWPTCQDPTAADDDTDAHTFTVDVVFGATPPQSGVDAAITFAAEMARARSGQTNRLPARVQRVTRQGVEWMILDPMAFLDQGKTGIYEVDLFLTAMNPHRQTSRSRVLSPDVDHTRRTSAVTPGGTP